MATLAVDGNELVVRLSTLEKIGALRGNIRLPLASVRAVRVSETPWSELRGIRAPGTGLPGVISLCTRRGRNSAPRLAAADTGSSRSFVPRTICRFATTIMKGLEPSGCLN